MRYVCPSAAVLLTLTFLAPSVLAQDPAAGLSIDNYKFVSEQRLTRTEWFVTYRADLVNTGVDRPGVVATLTSLVPSVKVVANQGMLHFGPTPSNNRVTSTNTFTILVDRSVTFDFASLKWSFLNPVAIPGPDQTAPVGATITLNGSASTNPSGVGTLTYAWAFVSRPPGSNAALTNANNVISSFVIDLPGTYIVNLTVSNGTAQDTRSVRISTVNSPPVANAGPNQSVAVGSTVNLNGAASFDVDGDPLTYTWTFVSIPAGSNAASAGIGSFRSVAAFFVADTAGTFIVQLVVNDGKADSAASTVTITSGAAANTPPVANAGPNQSGVNVGATVQLNGAGSTDVNGDPLTYKWTLITKPAGSNAQLNNTTVVNPTFVADVAGTYVAQLIVNDGKIDSAASTVTIATSSPVGAPTANAGANQTVVHGATVTLNGSGTDPQNLPLTFHWSFNSKPVGSAAALSSTTVAKPTFVADKPGQYVLQLIVNNGTLNSPPATVTITTTNTAPVANPGANQTVTVGSVVNLDGGGSTDADNDPLTYAWSFTSRPNGSAAALSAATSKTPTFAADVAGTYVVQLIVNDGFASSDPKTVTITANAGTGDLIVPATLTIAPDQTLPYNVTLAQPAAADVSVQLQNSDPTKATLSMTSVVIPAGQTQPTRQVFITGVANGNLTITATAPGRNPGTTNVTVGVTATLTPANLTIPGPTQDGTLTITLSGQAQANLSFTVTTSNPNVLSVPGTVPLMAGNQSTAFKVTRVNPGTAIVTVSAPGFPAMTATVVVEPPGTITLSISNSNLYLWQPQTLTVTLSTPAGFGGTPVTIVADPKFLDVTPKIVTVPQGSTTATAQVRGVQVGNPTIGATAAGYNAATPLNVAVGATIAWVSPTVTLPHDAQQPDVRLTLFATVPGGLQFDPADGIVVTLTSSRPDVANFLHNTATFLWDASTEPTLRIPIAIFGAGTTILKAKGTNIPEVSMTLIITGPLGISTPALPEGNAGSPYTFTVQATGGATPYTWAATGLPANLTINSATGQITGTPSAAGTSTVNVTVQDSSNPKLNANATFSLKINQGTPASIAVSSGSPQSAKINTAFANPLRAIVKDANGNPLSGVTVTFTPPANGSAGGAFAGGVNTATTGADGIATSAVFTANDKLGTYQVQAAVNGNGALTTNFALTNTVGDAASITVSSGSPQSSPLNTAFALPLKALVKDAGGNPVPNVSVTFTAPAGGASGTFAGGVNTATTGADGIATSAVFTANGTQGTYNVAAFVTNTPALTTNFALTNTLGSPASIAVSSGSPQSAKINTAFANPLKALVKDANNSPLAGITVTFAVPASGAGAAFTNGNTAVTDANGIATSAILTANGTVGTYNVVATAAAGVTTNFSLTNTVGDAASITVSSGAPQSSPLNTAFALPLKALVKDAGGNPVPNVSVTFTPPAGGASGTFAGGVNTATTGADGIATSAVFTANGTQGTYNVAAFVTNTPALTTNFALTNTLGTPASIAVSSGAPQSAKINTAFALPLKALVRDSNNNPLAGITVTFAAPANGAGAAFANGNTAVTDASGIATSALLTANGTVGTYNVVATAAAGVTTNFSLTNTVGDAASIAVSSGAPQSAQLNGAFALPLKAIVKDAGGNPVPNVSVTFLAPAGGASGTFAGGVNTATTGADGIATSAVFTANGTQGAYNVAAFVTNTPALTTNFALTNTVGTPTSITVSSGAPQSTKINTAFALPLKALVRDINNNPLAGITVTFTVPANGAGAAFANGSTAVTDASGIATSGVLTANGTVGTYNVVATAAAGVTTNFSLTNTVGDPASIAVSSGSPQSAQVNTAFALTLKAIVKDAGGNPVPNIPVTFTPPANGASGTFAGGVNTATTGADGVATSAVFTANGALGTYNVAASVTANPALNTNFALTNTAGTPASIAVSSGSNQNTKINTAYAAPLLALVKDINNNPLAGITVTFTVPASGPSAAFAGGQTTAVTGANGIATSAALTANGTVGDFTIVATAAPGVTTNFNLINTVGDPASIAVSSGSPQSAETGTAFAQTLKAVVRDAGSNPVPNMSVTFTAPASGASGTFAGGQTTATATTDASGVATSPVFTANATPGGPYNVAATVTTNPGLTPANFALTNTVGPPASITVVSGANQSAKINAAFPNPLKAVVKDASNNLLSGITVTFVVPASGAGATFAGGQNTAVTDANGVATSAAFSANGTVGAYSITAQASASVTTTFALTNLPGDPASITAVSGTPQEAFVGAPFALPLRVQVKDAGGNGIANVVVTFTPPAGGASGAFAGGVSTATTDANGFATSAAFTANLVAGQYMVSAAVNGLNTGFALTNKALSPTNIAIADGTIQTATVNTAFAKVLKALVTDQHGNPVSGVTITFTAPAGAGVASGTFANNQNTVIGVTDNAGIAASSVFTANGVPGNYTVTATGSGLPTISFLLTNSPTAVASLAVSGGTSPQSTVINSVFPNALMVLARDANNNPVNGASIVFTVQPAFNGAAGTFLGNVNTATTNAQGIATSQPFNANAKAGTYTIRATVVNNGGAFADFVMTNVPGAASAISVLSGAGQIGPTNTDFPQPLQALVTDAGGNPIRAIPVTFTSPAFGPGGTFSNGTKTITVSTDSVGVAAVTFRANGSQGSYNVSAALVGGQTTTFNLTNSGTAGGILSVTNAIIGGNLQDTITIALDPPAPNGLPVTIRSLDKTKVLVGNSLEFFTTNLLEGTANVGTSVQALADTGQVMIEISAPNYNSATAVITLAKSGFVIAGPLGIGAAFDAFRATTTGLTVRAMRLDAQGNFVQTQQVRSGLNNPADATSGPFTVRVPVSVNVSTLGSLSAAFATFVSGNNNATVNFIASSVNTGATDIIVNNAGASLVCSTEYIQAGKICPAVTFTTPTTGAQLTATIKGSSLVPFSATVGRNLQKAVRVGLTGPAPSNVTVTITSTDPTKVLFSNTVSGAGTASINVVIPTNFSTTPDFYVQGYASTGSVPYTISAPTYGSAGGDVILGPSGFVIESPGGFGAANFQVQKGGGSPNITVHVGLVSGGVVTETQFAAPGVTIPVTVESSNTAVGTISTSPINIVGGTLSATTQFQPVETGVTAVTASSAGYQSAQVAATVTSGVLLVDSGITVGNRLQQSAFVILPQPAGAGGVQVTVQSNSPSLKLSATQTGAGSDSIVVTIPAGTTFGGFWVYGLADSGSATFTASTALYAPKSGTVFFVPSAIVIDPTPLSGPVGSSRSTSVFSVALLPEGISFMNVAGGQPVDVPIQTTSASIASVPSTVSIPAGGGFVTLTVQLNAAGGASVSVSQPAGFTVPSSFTSTTVTVTP